MKHYGGVIGFLAIAALVAGGLGWATLAALQLEQERIEQQAASAHADKVRLALWRLDGRLSALLATENGRPFSHYSAVFAPPIAFSNLAQVWPAGSVLEPSPLLNADLPSWMLLHFQADSSGWESPQVLSARLDRLLRKPGLKIELCNAQPSRRAELGSLSQSLPLPRLLTAARKHTGPATIQNRVLLARLDRLEQRTNVESGNNWRDYASRAGTQSKLVNPLRGKGQILGRELVLFNCQRNGEEWLSSRANSLAPGGELPLLHPGKYIASAETQMSMSPMVGAWVQCGDAERLLMLRLVKLENREVCQGILLDDALLAKLLAEEVQDVFPAAEMRPVREPSAETLQLTMSALPFRLETGESLAPSDPGWTGLRVGLVCAWVAALVALLAVGLGGRSLLALSASRVRFVSAVTHELRSPLTTLRLYLDMLLDGMIKDETQREEYLRTLHAETDRLSRLVSNVLDFSRLENQAPALALAPLDPAALLAEVQAAWRIRCETAGKQLLIENALPPGNRGTSDLCLLSQILGNLLDNACKYTRDTADARLWLRAKDEGRHLVFEVEDRGPGIPAAERSAVFRAFRRGQDEAKTTGGVGLGLALASRWAALLGGRVELVAPAEGGARFRLLLPANLSS